MITEFEISQIPQVRTCFDQASLSASIKEAARAVGFDLVGITAATSPPGFQHLTDWIEQGFAGEMGYIPRRATAYRHPDHVMANTRSVIMLAVNYHATAHKFEDDHDRDVAIPGRVAKYAQGSADYHDVIRRMLAQLADKIHDLRPGCRTRGVVDTAPLLERDFARLSGLGWFGKNTMLINKKLGSWLLLAALLTDLELDSDEPHQTSHCGTCTRCLDVCPTDAFVGPYVLDARKCISYLTIELRSPIPVELRAGVNDWIFGCDLCQDVCPWNRKAPVTDQSVFQPIPVLNPADPLSLLKMSELEFQTAFAATPLSRPGWEGMRRNAAIVLGNSRNVAMIPELLACLETASSVVQEAIIWAVNQLRQNDEPAHS